MQIDSNGIHPRITNVAHAHLPGGLVKLDVAIPTVMPVIVPIGDAGSVDLSPVVRIFHRIPDFIRGLLGPVASMCGKEPSDAQPLNLPSRRRWENQFQLALDALLEAVRVIVRRDIDLPCQRLFGVECLVVCRQSKEALDLCTSP